MITAASHSRQLSIARATSPPSLPNEIINVLESSDNWETLWNIAFSIRLIKGFQDDRDVHQQLTDLLASND